MIKFIAVIALLVGCLASPNQRIVNGRTATEGEIPYIISLRSYNTHICGGSILDESHVLTAAHCVYGRDPPSVSIQYGLVKITFEHVNTVEIQKITLHPNYQNQRNYPNDVAVLTLAGKIKLSDNATPVVLPSQGAPVPRDQAAILAGWGGRDDARYFLDLQVVNVKVYTPEDCTSVHGGLTSPQYNFCAGAPEGGKAPCNGDSGDPLTVNGVQYGILSWWNKPCAIQRYPVYANVSQYVDWIKAQTL